MQHQFAPTVGLILAGGEARRMGGGDKTLRQVGAVPILARIVEVLGPGCVRLVISANGDASRFTSFELPVVADGPVQRLGPLAGVLAGLDWAAATIPSAEFLLSVPGDTPFLPADLLQRLHRARTAAGTNLAYAASNGQIHPTIALWPLVIRERLREALLDLGIRRVSDFVHAVGAVSVDWACEEFDPFMNINNAADLAAADAASERCTHRQSDRLRT